MSTHIITSPPISPSTLTECTPKAVAQGQCLPNSLPIGYRATTHDPMPLSLPTAQCRQVSILTGQSRYSRLTRCASERQPCPLRTPQAHLAQPPGRPAAALCPDSHTTLALARVRALGGTLTKAVPNAVSGRTPPTGGSPPPAPPSIASRPPPSAPRSLPSLFMPKTT